GRRAVPPQHRDGVRCRAGGRRPFPGHGVRPGAEPRPRGRPARPAAGGRGVRLRAAGGPGAGARRRARHGPPRRQGREPDPHAHRPDVPAAVVRVIERMLAHDPADRYPTADAVARDLAAPGLLMPAGVPARRRRRLLAMAAGVLVVAALAGYAWRPATEDATP